jgi:AcrR family transcriptional regulator
MTMATQIKVNSNDPRVKRTRQLLKRALADLLAEKALQDITVQHIADRATLNRVTFYAHFEDKYDLVSRWISEGFVEQLEAALPVSSATSAQNLRLLCRLVLESLRHTHTQCRPADARLGPLFESALQEALYSFILQWLRHSSREDQPPNIALESVAAAASWTIFGAGIDWGRSSRPRPLSDVADELVAVLLRGASDLFQDVARP